MAIRIGELDDLSFASEVSGPPIGEAAGRPVLLLHGWGGRIESMGPVAAMLAGKGYHVHSLDLPGFGRSDLPPQPWGVAEYAQFVARYLGRAGLGPVNLIGHSFGGRISIALGADHASAVEKIVLTASAGVRRPPTTRDRIVALGKAALKLPGLSAFEGRLRRWGRQRFGSDDLKAAGPLEPTFRKVIGEDLLPCAARIAAPTLLIWGDQDADTPLWQGQALAKAIPDAGLVVFQGAGHFAYQERLPDFVRIVDTFFRSPAQT